MTRSKIYSLFRNVRHLSSSPPQPSEKETTYALMSGFLVGGWCGFWIGNTFTHRFTHRSLN